MSGLHSIRLPALPRVVPATALSTRSDCRTRQCRQLTLQINEGGNLRRHRLPSPSSRTSNPLLGSTACFFTTRHQSHTSTQQKRGGRLRATPERQVLNVDPLGAVLVDGPTLNEKEYRTLSVVICEPEPEEALPELVQSVLENFHEDTEPWFFREFSLMPGFKKIDWDARKQEVESNTGSLIEGNGALLSFYSKMPPTVQRDFVLGHALLAAEAQVQAKFVYYAEQKDRGAPANAPQFRAFGTTKDDVYYPDFFEGYWEVDAVLISLDVPKGVDNMPSPVQLFLRNLLDKQAKHVERYIRYDGKVICDRLYRALGWHANGDENMYGIWDPDHPGLWRVAAKPDHGKQFESINDSNVSMRAYDSGPGHFECSEFIRQWEMDGISTWAEDTPADISGCHTFQRYKWDANSNGGPDEMTSILTKAEYKTWMEHGGQILPSHEFLLKMLSKTVVPTFVEKIVMRHRRIADPHAEEPDD